MARSIGLSVEDQQFYIGTIGVLLVVPIQGRFYYVSKDSSNVTEAGMLQRAPDFGAFPR